ncbi:CDC15_2 [Blepharisma stoltei]|uniref:non-specific serine/threonine protein kinase n=1 Tax=Blepharisma stoltei TaxID=1481888 RepID=A0AAU9J9U6_9CILI|nr:unnamed protein product [Blepharisma stoltei]
MDKPQSKTIGNYQLGDCIGKGAFGKVYKALNKETAQIVAIKQISVVNVSEDQISSIHKEINLMKRLSHQNIVKYIDVISSDQYLNIVLEFIESGSLAAIIKKFSPFQENLVAHFTKQVLEGLCYLHSQGVVHRDIKGANLLTTKEGVVKLADFGVAMKLTESTKSMSIVGTPYWMAPEIVEQTGFCTTACDIWSLGCTVIELLTGYPPYFELETMSALYRIVQDDCPPLPGNISPDLKDFLLKCFQKEPIVRVDAPTLLMHPWIKPNLNEKIPIHEEVEPITNTTQESDEDIQTIVPINLDIQVPSPPEKNLIFEEQVLVDEDHEYEEKISTVKELKIKPTDSKKYSNFNLTNKSTKVEANEFGYFTAVNQLKDTRKQSPKHEESIIHQWNQSEANELEKMLDALDTFQNLDAVLPEFLDLLKSHPNLKELSSPAIPILKQILDELEASETLHLALQCVNLLCENDQNMQEMAACTGLLTVALRYIGEEYYKELRIEAAYLIGQLFQSSQHIIKLMLSSGGIEAIIKLLDPNYEENHELIILGIDCLLELMTEQREEYLRIWASCGVIERLALTLDNLNGNPDHLTHLQKTADLILAFSTGPRSVLMKFCEEDTLIIIISTMHSLPIQPKLQILRALTYLASDRTLQNRLENIGFVADLVRIINKDQAPEIRLAVLTALNYLCMMSPARQEQAVLAGIIPTILEIIDQPGKAAQISISLLCSFISASPACRAHLHNHNVLPIFSNLLIKYPPVFDAIALWVNLEPIKCEEYMINENFIQKLIETFSDSLHSVQSLQCMLKIINSSEKLCKEFGYRESFLQNLFIKLSDSRKEPGKIKNCLELLLGVVGRHPKPRQLLDKHNFYQLIVKVLHQSRDEDLVVLEEIATLLLSIYSHGNVNVSNHK